MAQRIVTLFVLLIVCFTSVAQQIKWSADGNSYYRIEQNEINQYTMPDRKKTVLVSKQQLTPAGKNEPLKISHYSFSDDQKKILLFTNTQRVWRLNTKGDYWVLDRTSSSLTQIGKNQPPSSMMFAKFSPDGTKVAYVSEYNVYVDDLTSNTTKALTTDGDRKMINGTFDWVYEEEFFCRDGIRWSPDSKSVAFFQVDARKTRDYYMVNFTDSVYSRIIPVEFRRWVKILHL
jgi:dipeptidyl-peptidase 4